MNQDGRIGLLDKISNGFNTVTEIKYQSLVKEGSPDPNNDFYTKGSSASFPVMNFQLPLYAVSEVKMPNGVGGNDVNTYFYEDARLHRQGKGFMGFGKTIAKNSTSQYETTNTYEFDNTYYTTALVDQSVERNGEDISNTTIDNEFIARTGVGYWTRVKDQTCLFMS